MEILKIENLTFSYPQTKAFALNNVSFAVNKGDFAVVCGATGSGKSTLLRMLKPELSPLGDVKGTVLYNSRPICESSCREIGFVMQNPEHQIVTDTVWHELAFGLENLNLPQKTIKRRVAETASYFGIEPWYNKKTAELSGGQKQLLNLASVMAMNPSVIVLDEPTAQLDPVSAGSFISALKKLNTELGITVIITEHRLEDIIPLCDKLLVLDKGGVAAYGSAGDVINSVGEIQTLLPLMPAAVRLYYAQDIKNKPCPLTLNEGRRFLETNYKNDFYSVEPKKNKQPQTPAVKIKNLHFKYQKDSADILYDFNLEIYENEIFCLFGANGAGKTTSLLTIAGVYKPYCGRIEIFGKPIKEYKNNSLYQNCLAMLPQDVQTVFVKNTVEEELKGCESGVAMLNMDLQRLYKKHPYDLSGGEQQLVALAKVLSSSPKLLLLDEPTKGLDANAKSGLAELLKSLKNQGVTVIMVSHDVEFAATCADRCALFFRGNAVSAEECRDFLLDNNFYTTSAYRMSKGYYKNAVTVDEIASLCLKNGRKNDSN